MEEEIKNEPSPKEKDQNEQGDQKFIENYERLCYNCWRPKCIYYCAGPCARAFHKKCWEKEANNDLSRTPVKLIQEKDLTIESWKEEANFTEICKACSEERFYL